MKNLQQHAQPVKKNNSREIQDGWVTLEMLYALPLLITAMMMALYFGMLMHTKMLLGNATHNAVQALAKSGSCDTAHAYFDSNFPYPPTSRECSAGEDDSSYSATYLFTAFPLVEILVPPTTLKSLSKAVTEKQD